MRRATLMAAALATAALAGSCGGERKKDLGQQTADISADTKLLGEAQSAVNEVLRNASECDLAKPYIGTAVAKLDEVEKQLSTTTGRATLDSLRKQLARVRENCP